MNNNNSNLHNNNLTSSVLKLDKELAEPDSDTIKMFVGQVPRSMDEDDLRKMFEEFGRVYSINVLRDKVTGASKGKIFVSSSRLAFHCKIILNLFTCRPT